MPAASYPRWLAVTALAYAVLHHLGSIPDGIAEAPRGTRWTDWLDLLVPWLLLTPAVLTVWADRPPILTWGTNAVGGGTVVMSVVLALVAAAYGWRARRDLGVVLMVAGLSATGFLAVELLVG